MIRAHKLAAVAASTAIIALGFAIPANAASSPPVKPGPYAISNVPGCHIVEEIKLQGSPAHDYMAWKTNGDSDKCFVEIKRNGVQIESRLIKTTAYQTTYWYYDGPGDTDQVWVENPSHVWGHGPAN